MTYADDLPILDADVIFMDNITVLAELPVLDTFNNDGTIRYFDPEKRQWQIYDYPEGATAINYSEQRSDGTYLLFDYLREGELLLYWIDRTWVFDPGAGTITRPNEQCGVAQDLPDEGRWVYFQADDDLVYLCYAETGELSPSLPEEIQGIIPIPCRREIPTLSPNAKTIIFSDCNPKGDKFLYVYNTVTRDFTNYPNPISNSNWLGHIWINQNTVLSVNETISEEYNMYLTNVQLSEQPKQIAHQYSIRPHINVEDVQPYIIWTEVTDLGHHIIKENLLADNSTILFTKDCEGYVDYSPYSYCSESQFELNPYNNNYLALRSGGFGINEGITIIDIESQNILYQAYTETYSPFVWLDETAFIYDDRESSDQEQQEFMKVTISEDSFVETPLLGAYTLNLELLPSEQITPKLSPNGHYILSYEQLTNQATRLYIYDVVEQTRYSITQSLVELGFSIYGDWNDDSTLDIKIHEGGNIVSRWTISIEN